MHKEGILIILSFAVVSIIFFTFSKYLGILGIILTCFSIYFFRDPERVVPVGDSLLVSPADGVVQNIIRTKPPEALNLDADEVTRVSIFLNIFNVHVNRVPISGTVKHTKYIQGKFFNASLDKASIHNERQLVNIQYSDKVNIGLVQIAGLIARRIVCDLEPEQSVGAGERYGIIRFGSRVDLYLPNELPLKVLKGQTMIGGETVIADLADLT